MRVAFDHQAFSNQPYGGISRYFVELASNLYSYQLCKPKIFAPFFTNNYLSSAQSKVPYFGLHSKAFKGSARLYGFVNSGLVPLPISLFNPDILHHTFFNNHLYNSKSFKHVLTVYDMTDEILPQYFPSHSRTKSLVENKKLVLQKSDHIISISHNTKADLVRLYDICPSKVSVVYLGHSLPEPVNFPPINISKPFILYVGARYKYKNFYGLLEAFLTNESICNDFHLYVFGGSPFSSTEISYFSSFANYNANIHHISGDDRLLSYFYSNASLFVYPSFYEGFGIPPLEAMSVGCPVACSSTSCLPEINADAVAYFDPYSISSISSAMQSVLYSFDVQQDLIVKGYRQAKKYSWARCAYNTQQIYQCIL